MVSSQQEDSALSYLITQYSILENSHFTIVLLMCSYKTHSACLVTEYNSPFLFLAPHKLKSVEQNWFLCHQCSGETLNFKGQGHILT